MQPHWIVLTLIVLLGSCSDSGSAEGDTGKKPDDSTLETNKGVGDANQWIRYTSFDGEKFEIRTGRNQGSPNNTSGDAWHDEAGDLWFLGDSGMHTGEHDGQGAYRYDGRFFPVINDETPGIGAGIEQLHIRCIFEDSRGNLWIGNNGLGVLFFDGQVVSNFTEQHV